MNTDDNPVPSHCQPFGPRCPVRYAEEGETEHERNNNNRRLESGCGDWFVERSIPCQSQPEPWALGLNLNFTMSMAGDHLQGCSWLDCRRPDSRVNESMLKK
jgi:hypothetical protein